MIPSTRPPLLKKTSSISSVSADPSQGSQSGQASMMEFQAASWSPESEWGQTTTQIRRLSVDRFQAETKATDARGTSFLRAPQRSVSTKLRQSMGIKSRSLLHKQLEGNDSTKTNLRRKWSASPPRMPLRKGSFIR